MKQRQNVGRQEVLGRAFHTTTVEPSWCQFGVSRGMSRRNYRLDKGVKNAVSWHICLLRMIDSHFVVFPSKADRSSIPDYV